MRRPERQPQRSLRQSASVVSSPPLYRMCHDVTVIGILAAEVSVSLTTKRVNRIPVTPYPFARCLRCERRIGRERVGATAKHVPGELVEQNYKRKRSFWTFFQCREFTSRRRLMDRQKRRTRACVQLRRIVTAASWTPARKFLASLS